MFNQNQKKFVRINRQINCPTVRVKKDGEHLGVMSTNAALDLAYREGLDVVEIAPTAVPPIVEIMDYSKFKFEEKKKKRDQQAKTKAVEPKSVRLRPVSGEHDVDTKINQLKGFLEDRHPVEVNILFKSREMIHKDLGFDIARKIVAALEQVGSQIAPPRFEGSRITVRLLPKSK